ncbi:hypothetical protein EV1_000462 [Malus domestica]
MVPMRRKSSPYEIPNILSHYTSLEEEEEGLVKNGIEDLLRVGGQCRSRLWKIGYELGGGPLSLADALASTTPKRRCHHNLLY